MVKYGLVPLAVSLICTGCMMGADYARPTVDVPSTYRYAPQERAAVKLNAWWEQFNDPELNALIRLAIERNLDLRVATLRLREYHANYVGTRAPIFPALTANVSETRARQGQMPIAESYQAGISLLSWELDFWGRIRRLSEAAYADFLGQEQARQSIILSLVSGVTQSYIQLREIDARLDMGRRTLEARKENERIAKVRYKMGVISEMELRQATSETQSTAISVQQLEQTVAQKENELNLLLGRNPGPVKRGLAIDALAMPAIPAGLPSDLLARRPDLLQAEQALIAANARVGAAKASFFPTISLTGSQGGVGTQLSKLFSGPSRQWSFTSGASLPIFSGGSLWAQLTVSESQREQAVANYQKAIQSAFRETEDALIAVTKTREQRDSQAIQVAEVKRYAELARLRYENGVSSHLEVLDSQRNQFAAEQGLAQARSAALIAVVNLYKVLGGDWGANALTQPAVRSGDLPDSQAEKTQ